MLLLREPASRRAALLAIGAVAGVVVGWGVAQWPYILPESLEVSDAAAPVGHPRRARRGTVGVALCIVLPGFVLLYVLDQRGLLLRGGRTAVDSSTDQSVRCSRAGTRRG